MKKLIDRLVFTERHRLSGHTVRPIYRDLRTGREYYIISGDAVPCEDEGYRSCRCEDYPCCGH